MYPVALAALLFSDRALAHFAPDSHRASHVFSCFLVMCVMEGSVLISCSGVVMISTLAFAKPTSSHS